MPGGGQKGGCDNASIESCALTAHPKLAQIELVDVQVLEIQQLSSQLSSQYQIEPEEAIKGDAPDICFLQEFGAVRKIAQTTEVRTT